MIFLGNRYEAISHQKTAVHTNRQRVAGNGFERGSGLLRMDVEVWLAGVAAVAYRPNGLTHGDLIPSRDFKAAGLKVPQQNIGACAAKQYMVPRHMVPVLLRHWHVGQAVHGNLHHAAARRIHGYAVNNVSGRVGRLQTLGAKSPQPPTAMNAAVKIQAIPPEGSHNANG